MTTTTETETDTTVDTDVFTARLSTLDAATAIAEAYAKSTSKNLPNLYEFLTKPDEKGSVQVRFVDGGKDFLTEAVEWAKDTKDSTSVAFPSMNQPAWYAARKISWIL